MKSLRPALPSANGGGRFGGATNDGVTPAGYTPGASGGFGADRSNRAAPSTSTGDDDKGGRLPGFTPQGRTTVNDYNESADFSGGRAGDFPAPYSIGGATFDQKPPAGTGAASAASGRRPVARTSPTGASGAAATQARTARPPITPADDPGETGPAISPTTAVEVAPGRVAVGTDTDPNNLPGMNQPLYPTAKPKATAAPGDDDDAPGAKTDPAAKATPPARKKPKIDPADLEKLMRSRTGGS